jgi:phosphoribosylformylglycinamidine (FGAM) synthase-like enzyme
MDVPVVGGNVSLYNDSATGPVPPTPTLAMLGVRHGYDVPDSAVTGEGTLVLVGGHDETLGGSEYLAQFDGSDVFPDVDDSTVAAVRSAANHDATLAVHDVSDGGLAVTLAEMVSEDAGVDADVPSIVALFSEAPGRAVVETTAPDVLGEAVDAPVVELGEATTDGVLSLTVASETVDYQYEDVRDARDVIQRELD